MTLIFLFILAKKQPWLIFHIQTRRTPIAPACSWKELECFPCATKALPETIRQVLITIPAHTYLLQLNGVLVRMLVSQPMDSDFWLREPQSRWIGSQRPYCLFIIRSLKWNSHIIQFIHLNCNFSSVSYIHSYIIITTITFKIFSSPPPPQNTLFPWHVSPQFLSTTPP